MEKKGKEKEERGKEGKRERGKGREKRGETSVGPVGQDNQI